MVLLKKQNFFVPNNCLHSNIWHIIYLIMYAFSLLLPFAQAAYLLILTIANNLFKWEQLCSIALGAVQHSLLKSTF